MLVFSYSDHRDIEPPSVPGHTIERRGRNAVAVIGINRYAAWPGLHNAVSDARGAMELFVRLGFEPVATLIDHAATENAMRHLVTGDLARLGPDDSLVLFFAGHGFTRTHQFPNAVVKTGYIIPIDGGPADDNHAATWVRLDLIQAITRPQNCIRRVVESRAHEGQFGSSRLVPTPCI